MGRVLVLGFAAGFLTSIGIGPLTLTAASRSILNGTRAGVAVGTGAAIMDVVVVHLLGMGLLAHKIPEAIIQSMAVVVGAVLIVGGVRKLVKSDGERFHELHTAIESPYPRTAERLSNHSAVGALLYIANPFFVVLWASILSLLETHGLPIRHLPSLLMFACAAGAGTLSLFWVLSWGVTHFATRVHVLHRAASLVPVVEIAVGIIVMLQPFSQVGASVKPW